MTIEEMKSLVSWAKSQGIKQLQYGALIVEFYAEAPAPMNLDPKELAKTLTDSMPPDSAMLFASTEDIAEESEVI